MFEDQVDFMAQRARSDGQWVARRGTANEFSDAGKNPQVAAHHRLKLRRFARDQLAQAVAGQCMPVIVKGFGETAAVIKGEVFAVVSRFGERDAFFGER